MAAKKKKVRKARKNKPLWITYDDYDGQYQVWSKCPTWSPSDPEDPENQEGYWTLYHNGSKGDNYPLSPLIELCSSQIEDLLPSWKMGSGPEDIFELNLP